MSMFSLMYGLISLAYDMQEDNTNKLELLKLEYKQFSKLPRKLKKKVRKRILTNYNFTLSLTNYNPLKF